LADRPADGRNRRVARITSPSEVVLGHNAVVEAAGDSDESGAVFAASRGEPWAEVIDLGVIWDTGAPEPHVVSDGSKVILLCYAAESKTGWGSHAGTPRSPISPTNPSAGASLNAARWPSPCGHPSKSQSDLKSVSVRTMKRRPITVRVTFATEVTENHEPSSSLDQRCDS
jgi:hypothetical protein